MLLHWRPVVSALQQARSLREFSVLVSARLQAAAPDDHDFAAPWHKLGVPADADETTIKKAYRRLVLKCAHSRWLRA